MGTKTLIRLLIALAAIGAVAAILHFVDPGSGVSKVTSTTSKKKVFSDFPINDVAEVEIAGKDETVTLSKGESAWEVKERDGYAADDEPIVSLLRDIWDLNIVQPLSVGRSQYSRLELVDPKEAANADEAATILTFRDSEGKDLASLWLGKVYEKSENRPNPFGGGMATSEAGRYVKTGSSHSVYLVGNTFDAAKTDASEWIDKEFFKVVQIKTIEIDTGNKAEDWKLTREDALDDFTLAGAGEGEELDANKASSMKTAFSNPQIEDVFTGDKAKENPTDRATFRISTFEGFEYEIAVGEKNDLNELPLALKGVTGKFEKKRQPGEEESDEEKEKLDEQFAEELKKKEEKLAEEKSLVGHVFKIRSYVVDSILKKKADLLATEEEGATGPEGTQVAPGVTLPGLPPGAGLPGVGAPKAKAPAPAVKSKAPAPKGKAAPKAAPETKPKAAPGKPKAKGDAPAPAPKEGAKAAPKAKGEGN